MQAQPEKKAQAIILRKEGVAIPEIAKRLNASKSSISMWVRGVELSPEVLELIQFNGIKIRNKASTAARLRRWDEYKKQGLIKYNELSKNPDFMFGLALYIGEGNKVLHCAIGITNSDPYVIKKAVEFFNLLGVPNEKINLHGTVHQDVNLEEANKFWLKASGLPKENLRKFSLAVSRNLHLGKFNRQPYGVCCVYFSSIELQVQLNYWMELALGKI